MILQFFVCLLSSLYPLIYSVDINQLRRNNHFGHIGVIQESKSCPQQYLHMVGDGWCDYGAGGINLNIEECNFDGGDCCVGSCGITTGSHDSSASFYCGVVGYNCLDPRFANKTENSSSSIIDLSFANATTVIVSETIFQGTALLVNGLARKSHQLSNVFQYLSWNALDISSSNVIIVSNNGDSGSGDPAKPPPKPPRPPVHPIPPPPPHPQAKTTTTLQRKLSTRQQEVEIYNGERWVVTNVHVNAGTYRRRNAVATVSWTMAYQQFQLINVSLSNEKSTQQKQQKLSLSNQQASETWLSSNVLERSLRFVAQSSHLSMFSNMKVCDSQVSNSNETLSHTYSNNDIEACLQDYTLYSSNRYIGDLSTLYESPLCQQRLSDAWQDRYGQEGYLKWMIVYVTLWLLVWLFAMKYWIYHTSFGSFACLRYFDGFCNKASHQLLPNDNHSNNIPHEPSSVEMKESAHGSVHSQPHPTHQLSGRRHHRRRILEHVLMFYSVPSSTRSINVDRDDPNDNTDHNAGARHHRMSMLSQLWYMLRIPGFFSRSMLSMILVIVASLRVAHYFWILAPYLTVISDSSASKDDILMVKSLIVCREFSFAIEEQEITSNMAWKDGYLMSFWLIAFHVCFCWSLVSAVARHLHVAVRRSMVALSLPFLSQSPSVEQSNNNSTVNKETNPLSSGLPHAPLSEGTLSASAISETHPQSSNGLALASVNVLHPAENSEHHREADNLSVSASHGTLVPALLHLQILHFVVTCVVLTTLALMIIWMVVAVIVQKTHVSSMVSEIVLRGLTGSGVEMFLHWTQRVTGAILVLESVILLTVSHWLARLHYVVYQQCRLRNDEVSTVHEQPVVSSNVRAWIVVYVAAICLFILGILTILVSHEYFQHTDKEEVFMEENAPFEHRQETHVTVIFSVYSLALRIVEFLALVMVGMFLTFQDVGNTSMFLNMQPELDPHGYHSSHYGSGLSTPHFCSEDAQLMHQASMESGQTFGTQHMNTIQRLGKLGFNNNKETIQKGNEVGASGIETNSNADAPSVDSNHTARSSNFVFGYGYEGIGPMWLSLNWVRHWQKQEEQYIATPPSVTNAAFLDTKDNNNSTSTEKITNIEETVHTNTWWNWYSSKPQQKNSDPIISNSHQNNTVDKIEKCVCEEEDNSRRFVWTNPMSSMMFAYHPLSGSNTNAKNISDCQENENQSLQSQQQKSASISFHVPQLSSSLSTAVLTDVVGYTNCSNSHASTMLTSDIEQSTPTVDKPVVKSDPVWPSSLFNRRSSPHTDKGNDNHTKEKMHSLSQKDNNLHRADGSVKESHSVLTNDFLSEENTPEERSNNLYGTMETNISSHGNSLLSGSHSN